MKSVLFLTIALAFVLSACEDEKPTPANPPVVVEPTPVVTKPTPRPVDPDAEYCKKGEKKFECGNAVWLGLVACGKDTDGDNIGEGPAYFMSIDEIASQAAVSGVPVKVTMKDQSVVQFGVGFAAPCSEL